MQTKIKDVKMHYVQYATACDAKFDVPVAEGKLVLVECKSEEALLFRLLSNQEEIKPRFWLTGGKVVKGLGTYCKPIIISETEKIEVGDWHYHKEVNNIGQVTNQEMADFINIGHRERGIVFKVLVLPEQFSPKDLQAIVDGEMKDGETVLVECEDGAYLKGDVQHINGTPLYYETKLNSQGHVTIYKVEEKMVPVSLLESAFNAGYALRKAETGYWGNRKPVLITYKEWFEQNVK
jgi:hypothetical protein